MMEWRTLMKKTISLQISVVVGMLMMLLALAPMSAQAASITFDLWAKTGTVNLPGSPNTPVWGFAATSTGPAQIPGPEIVVTEGDVVTVHLHNNLAETTAIWFQGQGTAPDLTGAAAGRNPRLHVHGLEAGDLPVRGGTTPQRGAPGRNGAVRRPDR